MSLFLDDAIPELADRVRSGAASHVDYAREVVARREALEPMTHAWVAFDAERLLAEAAARDAVRGAGVPAGLLHGIPVAVKDIFNTRDFPTQMGSELWKGFTPGNNARVVDVLLWQGAMVAGKTVTAEFAVHHLNETLNPFDTSRTPGTSSSGSAVAVATGMVPCSLGTQTAGSIVRPASFCGVWGMKPSFGLIPRTGVLKTTDSLDTVGFFASHLSSLRVMLDAIRVKGPDYPFVYKHVDRWGTHPKSRDGRWKIGFVQTHVWDGARDYVRAAVGQLANAIADAPGCELSEVTLPECCARSHDVHRTIYDKSLAYYFEQESKHSAHISPVMAQMIETGRRVALDDFRHALREQERISDAIQAALDPFDLVLSIGTSSTAPPRGTEELPDPSLMWTLSHVPAVSVPAFVGPDGLPFSCQFVASQYRDYRLLQGLEHLEQQGMFPGVSFARERFADVRVAVGS